MKISFAERNEIYRQVRSILIRYWIDQGFLSVHVSEQTVYIKGSLKRIPGVPEELTGAILESVFADIKRIRNVTRVNAKFDNWEGDVLSGGWRIKEDEPVSNWAQDRWANEVEKLQVPVKNKS